MLALEKHGQLKRVKKEVNWNLEAGAIIRLVCEKELPSPHFQKIKGYSPEYTIFGAPVSSEKKLAIALGLKPETSIRELSQIYLKRKDNFIKPVLIDKKNAPCKQNISLGSDVNLLKFPAPMLHDGDGGRYLCTWHATITKDPDTGWVNYGMYRAMIHTKSTMGGLIEPNQHIGYHFYRKYKPRKQPMPFAVAIGPDPITGFIASARVAAHVSEPDVIGAMAGEPLELVKCETNDLKVPAHAEIILEGEISPTETEWEGPFGEFTGYRASPRDRRPLYKVNAITHRDNPVLTSSCMGTPVDESDVVISITGAAEIHEELEKAAIPVVAVNRPPQCIGHLIIVSINAKITNLPYMADKVASCIWGSEYGTGAPYVIVVEDDVDVYDIWQVLHALTTKCHPWRGIHKVERCAGHSLMPFLSRQERLTRMGAKSSYDCIWPLDWDPSIAVPPRASFDKIFPPEIQKHVLKNWESYGFDKLKDK